MDFLNTTHVLLSGASGGSFLALAAAHVNQRAGFAYVQLGPCASGGEAGGGCCVSLAELDTLGGGSYTISRAGATSGSCGYSIVGGDADGLYKGVWRFVRSLRPWRRSRVVGVPLNLRVVHSSASEAWRLRGHQISCAIHPSQFRTWDELESYALDLHAFGTNQLELAHVGGAEGLPIEGIANFSKLVAALPAMRVSLWWPSSLSSQWEHELAPLFREMRALDTIFFPGGDGGELNLTAISHTVYAARASHPHAQAWISLQSLDADGFAAVVEQHPEVLNQLEGQILLERAPARV